MRGTNWLAHWIKTIPAWAWPRTCLLCGTGCGAQIGSIDDGDFCADCRQRLPRHKHACRQCALPLAAQLVCGRCHTRPPPFSRTLSAFSYHPPVTALIHRLKYGGGLHLAQALGRELAARVAPHADGIDAIVPVPLHPSRVRERGFNHALEIARPLARTLGIPLQLAWARRVRATAQQTKLARDERARNVRRAFSADPQVAGRRIAIVDDVMTSGHTVTALAHALRAAKAQDIHVWVVARA